MLWVGAAGHGFPLRSEALSFLLPPACLLSACLFFFFFTLSKLEHPNLPLDSPGSKVCSGQGLGEARCPGANSWAFCLPAQMSGELCPGTRVGARMGQIVNLLFAGGDLIHPRDAEEGLCAQCEAPSRSSTVNLAFQWVYFCICYLLGGSWGAHPSLQLSLPFPFLELSLAGARHRHRGCKEVGDGGLWELAARCRAHFAPPR